METLLLTAGQYTVPTDATVRGRYKAPSAEQVLTLAHSMRTNGQLQPIGVKAVDGGLPEVVFGFTRHEAAEQIRNGYEYNGKTFAPVPYFALRAEYVEVKSDEDKKVKTYSENIKRNNLSPVDVAYAIKDLRENVFTNKQKQTASICELFGKDKAWVSRYSSLLQLPQVALDLVHIGEDAGGIGVTVGNELTKSSNALSEEDIIKLCEEPAKLTVRAIADYVEARDKKPEGSATSGESSASVEGEESGEEKPIKVKSRTIQDVKELAERLANKDDADYSDIGGFLGKLMLKFVDRGIDADKVLKNLNGKVFKNLVDAAKSAE